MAIEESIDEVKIAGAAATRADRERAGDMRIGAGCKGRHFLMADMDPFNRLLSANLVDYPIERVANYSIDSLNSGRGERCDKAFCYRRHDWFPLFASRQFACRHSRTLNPLSERREK
jgi:hypothetical protein